MDKTLLIRVLGDEIDRLKQGRSDLIALGWPPNAESIIMMNGKIEGLRHAIRTVNDLTNSKK